MLTEVSLLHYCIFQALTIIQILFLMDQIIHPLCAHHGTSVKNVLVSINMRFTCAFSLSIFSFPVKQAVYPQCCNTAPLLALHTTNALIFFQ